MTCSDIMESTEVIKFRKVGRLAIHSRKRGASDSENDDEFEDGASTSYDVGCKIVKSNKSNAMIQSTAKNRMQSKKQRPSRTRDNSASESDDAETTAGISIEYKAARDNERHGPRDMGATATLEIETEHDKDAQAQFERTQAVAKEIMGKSDDKVYRGMSTYGQFFEKKDTSIGNASSGLNRKGPIRAPVFVRQSVRWDYQPDICKDYKETGFCGFGDSCKFLHDRSDYKHGWEIEREYREGRYGKGDEDPHKFEVSEDEEDDLPFKCVICRQSFVDPVVTKCKHYFCEKCALERFRKTHKCYVCEKGTGGIFSPAKDIIAKIKCLADKAKQSEDKEESDLGLEGVGDEDTPIERLPDTRVANSAEHTDEDSDCQDNVVGDCD